MKESRKQLKAQAINEAKRMYEFRIESLQKSLERCNSEIKLYRDECHKATVEASSLKRENDELKNKLAQYEEWIERMQDFCNLPEGERQQAFKTYLDNIRANTESAEALNHIHSFMDRISSLFVY